MTIPVTLRPEDVYAAKIPSKHINTSNLLLKFTVPKRTGRKRKRGSNGPFIESDSPQSVSGLTDARMVYQSLHDNEGKYQSTVVGIVRDTHRYRSKAQEIIVALFVTDTTASNNAVPVCSDCKPFYAVYEGEPTLHRM
jgi:hypothetical protein